MAILYTLFIGLLIGLVAKLFVPGKDPGGLLITAALGIAGAAVAQAIAQFVGFARPGEPQGFIASVLGSMLLLFLYRRLTH
jgi:uncharacterized membrane protein YeaQ/YmgE (transglycosylase-associated protein family)